MTTADCTGTIIVRTTYRQELVICKQRSNDELIYYNIRQHRYNFTVHVRDLTTVSISDYTASDDGLSE
jgi:hypothetical protein